MYNNSINEFCMSNYRVIILCMQQRSNIFSRIQNLYMFYRYEADKWTQLLCTCDRAHTHTSLSIPFHSCVVCCSSLISSCPCDRLIGFDVVNFIIIFLIASIHFTNFIIKTPKFVASKAKQNKTPSTDMTWKEKVTLKVLISFQSNLRSKRANIFIYMTMNVNIFETRHLAVLFFSSIDSHSVIRLIIYYPTLIEPILHSINK